MSAPLFLVDDLPAGPAYTLTGPEGHHAADVQRLRAGEALVLSDGRGGTAAGTVTAVRRGSVDVMVTGRRRVERPDPSVVVVQAIAKGDRGELAVQAMTEVGVDEIVPWAAGRSVAQWRGDLFVHLDVRTPMKLSVEQERMLRDFAKTRGEDVAELTKQGGFFSRMRDAFNGH